MLKEFDFTAGFNPENLSDHIVLIYPKVYSGFDFKLQPPTYGQKPEGFYAGGVTYYCFLFGLQSLPPFFSRFLNTLLTMLDTASEAL